MSEYKDYVVAIYSNGDAIHMSSSSTTPNAEVRYLIQCKFLGTSFSGKNAYYKNIVFTPSMEKVEGNKLHWDGIECTIEENEEWGTLRGNWQTMLIKFALTDKLGVTKNYLTNNAAHKGGGFQCIMEMVLQLAECDTHNARRAIEKRENIIEELTKRITALETKSAAS